MKALHYSDFPGVTFLASEIYEDNRGQLFESSNRLKDPRHYPNWNVTLVVESIKNAFRGLHYQLGLHAQAKLIRCVRGEIQDFFLDLRLGSPTYGELGSYNLRAESPYLDCLTSESDFTKYYSPALFLPIGFAHGYRAREDSIVLYHCSMAQDVASERAILFPFTNQDIVSTRDKAATPIEQYLLAPKFKWDDGETTCL